MNEQEMSEWECVEWKRLGANPLEDDLSIRLMRSPFYEGDKFAVRRRGLCLTTAGALEWEPMPSSRDDDFYKRCRFDSFAAAVDTLRKSAE